MCDRFDLVNVHNKFQNSLNDDDDVHLDEFLEAYEELNKFFFLMGSIFSFVNDELTSKMQIIRGYRKENEAGFKSVKTMIEFEKDKLRKSGYVSGCRTLLLLHRALDFIRLFLKSIGEMKDEDNTGCACRAAYNATLGNHHSFFIATGARLAMYTMPNKGDLLAKVCGNDKEFQDCSILALPKTLEVTATVYDRILKLYTQHNLLNLP